MEFSYEKILETLMKINAIEELQGKLFVSGGIVPWLLSEKDSGRLHGDIDLICKQENMDLVRQKLKEYNIYAPELDSLTYSQEGEVKDYGVDTYIGGVPVGFYPCEIHDHKIVQRSFSTNLIDGKPDLKVKILNGLDEKDYFATSTLSDGTVIGHSSLEMIKATKLIPKREKDYYDISQIDAIGIDKDRWERVVASVGNMKGILNILYPDLNALTEEERKEYQKDAAFLVKYHDKFDELCQLYADRRDAFSEKDFNRITLDITKSRFDPETIICDYIDGLLEFLDQSTIVNEKFDTFMDLIYFERSKEFEYKDIALDKTPITLKKVFALTEEFLAQVDESGELLREFNKLKKEDGIQVLTPESEGRSIYQDKKIQYVFDGTVNTANTLVHEFMHCWCDIKAQTSMDYANYTMVREFLSIYYENAFIRFMDDKGLLKNGERPLLADRLKKDFEKDPQGCMLTLFELAHKKKIEGCIDKESMLEIFALHSTDDMSSEQIWEQETKKIVEFTEKHVFAKEVATGFSAYRFCTGLAHYASLSQENVKSMFQLALHIKDGVHDPIFLQEYLKTIGEEEFHFPHEETSDMAGAKREEKYEEKSESSLLVEKIGKRVMPATTIENKNFVSKIFGRWKEKFLERTGEFRDDK